MRRDRSARPPRRVAVRNPRGRATRPTTPGERALAELKEQTEVGEVLLRSLTRAQLMLAVRIFAVFGFFLLGLPALFATLPRPGRLPRPRTAAAVARSSAGRSTRCWSSSALLYVRQAERNERDFVEFIERS